MNWTEIGNKTSLWLASGLMLSVVVVILVLKSVFKLKGGQVPGIKNRMRSSRVSRSALYKYPEVDIFSMRAQIWVFGLVVALGLSLLGMNNTTYNSKIETPMGSFSSTDEIQVEIPRTVDFFQPPPPPPPASALEIITVEKKGEKIEFIDQSIQAESKADASSTDESSDSRALRNTPYPASGDEPDEIYKVVEEAPRYPGCEDKDSQADKQRCSEYKLLQYLFRNIRYPDQARLHGVQGKVIITFIVEKDGRINEPKIVQDIGHGCGEEALRVVKSMNEMSEKWHPGKQRGYPVRVQINLPVQFKLN